MREEQWDQLKRCAAGEEFEVPPVALIVDSPWLPGYLGISTLDYLTVPEVWLEANLTVAREFPEVIFVPGFWVEMGMGAEPSAFGCKLTFHHDRTPDVHALSLGHRGPVQLDAARSAPRRSAADHSELLSTRPAAH